MACLGSTTSGMVYVPPKTVRELSTPQDVYEPDVALEDVEVDPWEDEDPVAYDALFLYRHFLAVQGTLCGGFRRPPQVHRVDSMGVFVVCLAHDSSAHDGCCDSQDLSYDLSSALTQRFADDFRYMHPVLVLVNELSKDW